jgi:phage tail-like protein
MARAQQFDPLHSFRFWAEATAVDGTDLLSFTDGTAQAGFQMVGTPKLTVEIAEYREGTDQWTRKYPGRGSWDEVSMKRGVMKTDSRFFVLSIRTQDNTEYRADIPVYRWHRDGKEPGQIGDLAQARIYTLHEAVPSSITVAGDLDAGSSEISVAELSIAFEWAEITQDVGIGTASSSGP